MCRGQGFGSHSRRRPQYIGGRGGRRRPWELLACLLALLLYVGGAATQNNVAADDDDLKSLDDDNPTYQDALGWIVAKTGKGCYTATRPLQELGLRMCPVTSPLPVMLANDSRPYVWVNGTVTNVGKSNACGFSFTSLDADLSSAALTIPPNLPVNSTIQLLPGQVLSYAFLLPMDAKTLLAPFVSMSNEVIPCTTSAVNSILPGTPTTAPAPTPAAVSGVLPTLPPVAVTTPPAPAPAIRGPAVNEEAASGTGGWTRPPLHDMFTSSPELHIATHSSSAARGALALSPAAIALVTGGLAALLMIQQLPYR